ncbi:cereblon family protein [Desulfobulbus oligotrophicus]|jgi:hypothetical protein|uniref:CULT domain-containing protein n=1 Tax=Desulfobulbus oligotrophicus TaxID=1909699 RepID=A0A7T6AP91_9BACT|nr:cereblon family protein [Desulfobulbus oligotrophicus]MDY0390854.1 cereblon family protein [Desulfobulbus oligotrophicus]QQG64461.1 hypothetical protein HP555_00590 [Desulfobulbus oligotrophicus]
MLPDQRICRVHLPRPGNHRPPAPENNDTPVADENAKALRCTLCNTVITGQEQAVAVQGGHEHAFFNPAGIAFEIRCFRTAPGAIPQGNASDTFTWFSGYHWQIVLCINCHTHLGWRFIGDSIFFGLIASRLQ